MALFRGSKEKLLNAMLIESVEPFDDSLVCRRIPPISLELNFVYGFQAFECRNSLSYAHFHQSKPKKMKGLEKERLKEETKLNKQVNAIPQDGEGSDEVTIKTKDGPLFLPPHLQKQMLFSKQQPIPYDEKHEWCERYFVYFVSRIAIVFNPFANKQRFYQGHKYRITCLAMHPSSKFNFFLF